MASGGGDTGTFDDVKSGQIGGGQDGVTGTVNGVSSGQVGGGQDEGVSGQGDGLHPDRPRGFAHLQRRQYQSRFEAPSVNDLRARQEATVADFLTFYQRKNTLVVDLYKHCFYKLKPNQGKIAKFIYQDLCPLPQLREAIEDVQFHPVKMLLFVMCCSSCSDQI